MALEHLRRQTFEWEGVDRDGVPLHISGVVRERATVDKFRRTALKALIPVISITSFVDDWTRGQFADYVILTESLTGLSWWVDAYASNEALVRAFEQWQVMPPQLADVWSEALSDVNRDPTDDTNGTEPVDVDENEDEDSPNE